MNHDTPYLNYGRGARILQSLKMTDLSNNMKSFSRNIELRVYFRMLNKFWQPTCPANAVITFVASR